MKTFTVYEPAEPASDRVDRAEDVRFVPDGFSWSALLFPAPWLLTQRLWLPLIGFLISVAAITYLFSLAGVSPVWPTVIALGLQLLIGFEAGTLRRWKLERMGWQMIGTVTGRHQDECERRFFESWLPEQPVIAHGTHVAGSRARWTMPVWGGPRPQN